MTHETYQLLAAYAVDAVTPEERVEVEAFLEQHPEHLAEVFSLQDTAATLAADAETAAPAALRSSVLTAVSQVRPLPPVAPVVPLRRRRAWFVAAAAAAVVGVGGVAVGTHRTDLPQNAMTQVSNADDARNYVLAVPGHSATVTRSRAMGKAVFRSERLGTAPAGHSYQLWLQQPDGSMASAGVLPAPKDGVVTMELEGNAARAVGVGITVEPAGGSPQPTSKPLAATAF